jgi:uncharacterized membrane protein YobD (UPF0266 family)
VHSFPNGECEISSKERADEVDPPESPKGGIVDVHRYKARVTRTRFGKWVISSIFSDDTVTEFFFRTPKVHIKEKALMFGFHKIKAEEIKQLFITDKDDIKVELANEKTLYVVFNEGTRDFIKDMESIGVRSMREPIG